MKKIFTLSLLSLVIVLSFLGCNKKDDVTSPTTDPEGYIKADGIRGGAMYDKFWSTEAGYNQSDTNIAKFNAYADFFRCKQCHGWDYLGNAGAYINRGPKTNRPNIASGNIYQIAMTKSPQELFNALKKSDGRRDISYDLSTYNPTTNSTEGDKMPKLSQILTDAQIWDIVKYLKTEALDVTQLYSATFSGTYPTGSASFSNIGKDGDASVGKTIYTQKCATCHGADGKTFLMENMSVGEFTRKKPYEVQHKVKFGQLGSTMVPGLVTKVGDMKNLYKALADTVAFPK